MVPTCPLVLRDFALRLLDDWTGFLTAPLVAALLFGGPSLILSIGCGCGGGAMGSVRDGVRNGNRRTGFCVILRAGAGGGGMGSARDGMRDGKRRTGFCADVFGCTGGRWVLAEVAAVGCSDGGGNLLELCC